MSGFRGHWIKRQAHFRLMGEQCAECGAAVFPPQPNCPRCADGEAPTTRPLILVISRPIAVDVRDSDQEVARYSTLQMCPCGEGVG